MKNNAKIKSMIRTIPDFPKPGIMFRDVTTLLEEPEGFRLVIDDLAEHFSKTVFDKVVGLEARGFIIGGALAYRLGKGFIPIRKKGKLPHATESFDYELEYGTDTIEIHKSSVRKGDRILLIDDLLATGGTALAGAKLVEKLGGEVVEIGFVIDLPEVGGRQRLAKAGYKLFTLCEFEGE